ncbi:MAG: peptidase E [Acidimicrobiia bacterium]|nr:peptidase E [Acidimicrobiia bacterium]
MSRHIVAMGGGGFSGDDAVLDRYVLDLVSKERPKVAFLGTASGDAVTYEAAFYEAFVKYGCEPRAIRLFGRDIEDLAGTLLEQDIVYVGGGNTANMLAVWRLHGVDEALRQAWESGVVLAGVSAGANCWFEASTTDSFLVGTAKPLNDGLGLVPGSFCPHYDSEPERRPRFLDLVGSGQLPAGYACDDFAALHIADDEITAIASQPDAGAHRVEVTGETPLDVQYLG